MQWRRIIGITLLGAGVFGILLSLVGLIVTWWAVGRVHGALNRELDVLDQALAATGDGLVVAGASLGDARVALGGLETAINGATAAISDTLPTARAAALVVGNDLPETIRSTQTALGSARETARVVDRALGTISAFGLIPQATYSPQVPLNEAIGQVATSLERLPESLSIIGTGLEGSADNLGQINLDLITIAREIDSLGNNLDEAGAVIADYRQVVGDLREDLAALRRSGPGWLRAGGALLTLFLLWLGLAQVGLLYQSWEMLRPDMTKDEGRRLRAEG